jgi:hypothetical protein
MVSRTTYPSAVNCASVYQSVSKLRSSPWQSVVMPTELNGVRIDVEPVGVFVIVKCIYVDGHPVVRFDVSSLRDASANLGRTILADPADVEIVGVE